MNVHRVLRRVFPAAVLALSAAGCARRQPVQVLEPVQLVLPASPATAGAGAVALPSPTSDSTDVRDSPFYGPARMEWPGPNRQRSASGMPGPDYWQQRADYDIAAALDPATQTVSGTVTIRYTNNSPDTLRWLWLQLDQNIYARDSWNTRMFAPGSRYGALGFEGGYTLGDVTVDGRAAEGIVSDTRMRLPLERPLAPRGGRTTVRMTFRFRVPEHGTDRTGRDGDLYAMAQWHPRMAVYDDVRGWNADPYFGAGEFYLEYGDFDYAVTVPAGWVVAGTGELRNPQDVLSAVERARLAKAARADTGHVTIVSPGERTIGAGTRTWRFHAENVRDVAWAAAPDFQWDAGSWDGVMLHAYHQPQRTKGSWAREVDHSRWSIRTYSELFARYPYPQITSVASTIGGMEYPMVVFNPYGTPGDTGSSFGVNDHEIAHQWFPMAVGSNERRYTFMDEGFASYMNAFSNERRTAGLSAIAGYVTNWRSVRERGILPPLMTRQDHMNLAAIGAAGYRKPAVALLTLRNHVVGRDAMDLAMREYYRRWFAKHPTPADFFRTVEDVTGYDLGWYWRAFFYTNDVLDLGIDSVRTERDSTGLTARIALRQVTSIPFPPRLRLRFADGSTRDVDYPVDVWARGPRVVLELRVTSEVTGARLWPDATVPDWEPANDTWGRAPAADAPGPVTAGGLTTPIPPAVLTQ